MLDEPPESRGLKFERRLRIERLHFRLLASSPAPPRPHNDISAIGAS